MLTNVIVILGPTASGKTSLAVRLAKDFNGEIISADSRQVYKGMDVGTGKDLSEYHIEDRTIPYHLIDIIDPHEEFNVFEYQRRFHVVLSDVIFRKALPILVGGTGLYLESVLLDYNMPYAPVDEVRRRELSSLSIKELQEILFAFRSQLHNKTDLEDKDRLIRKIEIENARKISQKHSSISPEVRASVFGILWDRTDLRKRIALRLDQRLSAGLIEEVERLHQRGVTWERLESFGLEYRFVARYLQNIISKDEMVEKLRIAIGQFAKRQMTWFRRMEKRGVAIEWIHGYDYGALQAKIRQIIT